jgi:arginyl-tRNA synthetase
MFEIQQLFPDYNWNLPTSFDFGVLTTNIAFIESRKQARNPVEIANSLVFEINQKVEVLGYKASTKGPYINLEITDFSFVLNSAEKNFILPKSEQKILLDYIALNVAKPMHIGHVRNGNLGESLNRILRLKYPDLLTDNHWGDWGVQFGILVWSYKELQKLKEIEVLFNDKIEIVKLENFYENSLDNLVKLYVWGNQQEEKTENWKELVRIETLKLEQKDEENLAIWQKFVDISKKEMKADLEMLNVSPFDLELGESSYLDECRDLEKFLDENNLWEKDGLARYFDFEKMAEELEIAKIKNLGRCYLISSNGYSSYAFRDVAARIVWARDYDRNIMITVTASEQKHHFEQFFQILNYLNTKPEFRQKYGEEVCKKLKIENLIHIPYGFLKLVEGKMSTRKGNFLTARDLVHKVESEAEKVLIAKNSDPKKAITVAMAALKWYDLAKDSLSEVVLDIPKILSFEGNTGVYQLYTIARLNSILDKVGELGDENFDNEMLNQVLNSDEKLILTQTKTLPLILENITKTYKPHLLCNHLYEVATKVNSWYAKYSVTSEKDLIRKKVLLKMCKYLKQHLILGLDLLAIDYLEKL